MTQIHSVAVSPPLSSTTSTSTLPDTVAANRAVRGAWFERLDGYLGSPKEPFGESMPSSPGSPSQGGIDWMEIFAILGGKNPRMGGTLYRFQRSADKVTVARPASREPIVGAPLSPDFGRELIQVFRRSELNTWQRADVVGRVLQEWADEGPSEQAGKRLQKLFEPVYIDTPDEPAGSIVVDSIMLHLIDRGRYSALVTDHIESLKRTRDYDLIVNALHRHYPEKDLTWVQNTVNKLLGTWDLSLPTASGRSGDSFVPPGIDLDGKLRRFHQLMNPDYRAGQDRPLIERNGAEERERRALRPS